MEKIKEKIKEDLNLALKEQKKETCSVLRMLLSNILLKEKEKNYALKKEGKLAEENCLTDEEVLEVAFSEVKKRKDSILLFEKGNRLDLAEKEKEELSILSKYLPKQMTEEEVKEIVKEVIDSGKKEFKDIISEVMPKVKGKADGSLVSKIIREILEVA